MRLIVKMLNRTVKVNNIVANCDFKKGYDVSAVANKMNVITEMMNAIAKMVNVIAKMNAIVKTRNGISKTVNKNAN